MTSQTAAIQARGLGKRYRITRAHQHQTLRDSLVALLRAPLQRLRGLADEAHPEFWALHNVTFDVPHGQALGIIGRNGAGKSTLLKVLSRITAPTAGSLDLYGRVGSLLEVGTGFHPELSGRENIFLNGAILGMTRSEILRKFDEMVDFAAVEQFIDTPVKFYSSGMYMRLAFAVAAHLETEILLVDEVLAVGDASFQKKCLGKMGDVARQGRTVLFVSHQMNAIEELCSRCILLQKGELAADSLDVRQVIHQYLAGDQDSAPGGWAGSPAAYQNPYFKPLSFRLVGSDGQPVALPVRNDAALFIEIEGQIDVPDPSLTVGFAVYDEANRLLFWSYQTDQPEASWPQLSTGRNRLLGELPARLLNEGAYRFDLLGSLHFRQWLFEPGKDVPSFQVEIQGGLSDSPYWIMKRPGILAPVLKWVRL
ncbi:MAG: ABC transporter ATP-binding protein [Chloroflexota bacterium]